jgi:hypothetical protein
MSNYNSYSAFESTEEAAEPVATGGITASNVGGVTSTTFNGTETSTDIHQYAAVSASDLSPYEDSDWRSTARNQHGLPTNQITADSVVEVDGIASKVAVFVKAGVMVETPEGFALASETGIPQNGPADEPAESSADAATMPDESAAAINEALEPFDQSALDAGLAQSISVAIGDSDIAAVVKGVAQRSGMEPAEVSQRVNSVVQTYQTQTDSHLGKLGIPAGELPEFYEFCKQSQNKSALRTAIQDQMYARSMAGWKPLVATYFDKVAPDSGTLAARGFSVKGDQVRIKGNWMNIKAAARSGMI